MTTHLIIFGRIPDMDIPAKTGLGKEIGDEMKARKIGHDLTLETLEKFSDTNFSRKFLKKYFCYGGEYSEGNANLSSLQEKFPEYTFFPQENSAQKDVRGIQEAFEKIISENSEPFKIILVGTDIIGLNSEIVEDCFDSLSYFDACIVPVEDLGYGLVGISKNIDIISDIKNFDSRTEGYNLVQETEDLCTRKNISLFVHPTTCFDIDTKADAERTGLL